MLQKSKLTRYQAMTATRTLNRRLHFTGAANSVPGCLVCLFGLEPKASRTGPTYFPNILSTEPRQGRTEYAEPACRPPARSCTHCSRLMMLQLFLPAAKRPFFAAIEPCKGVQQIDNKTSFSMRICIHTPPVSHNERRTMPHIPTEPNSSSQQQIYPLLVTVHFGNLKNAPAERQRSLHTPIRTSTFLFCLKKKQP